MQKKTIVMIGSSCIDEYYEMDYVPRLGEKTLTRFVDRKVGGMIGNAAAVAASYGLQVYLMDRVNSGDNTKFILEDCKMAGIRLDMIRYDDSLPDVKCLLFLKDGERIIYVVPSRKRDVELDGEQEKILTSAEYVYTNLEELKYFRDTSGFLQWLHQVNTKLVLDVERIDSKEKDLEWEMIKQASVLFVNEEGDEQFREKISEDYPSILTDLGCMVVTTKGKHGCKILTPQGETYAIPAYAVKPVDTTGAGDTFNSSFLYGLMEGWDIKEAGRFANAAAARAILSLGARSGAVGEEAVKKFMSEWK